MTAIYKQVRSQMHDGDLGLVRGGGIVRRVSPTDYTHAFTLKWSRDDKGHRRRLMVAEFREGVGARIVTLSSQVRKYPRRIDIFRPTCTREIATLSADLMEGQAGHEYGWWAIKRIFFQRLSLVRLITGWSFDTTDMTPAGVLAPKICSQARVWCDRAAARALVSGWCPLDGKADWAVEPGDLALSSGCYQKQDDMVGLVL